MASKGKKGLFEIRWSIDWPYELVKKCHVHLHCRRRLWTLHVAGAHPEKRFEILFIQQVEGEAARPQLEPEPGKEDFPLCFFYEDVIGQGPRIAENIVSSSSDEAANEESQDSRLLWSFQEF